MKRELLFVFSLVGLLGAVPVTAGVLEDGQIAFESGDTAGAFAAFTEGAQAGDAASAYFLARMLELGLGVPADMQSAQTLYRQAAESGHVEALNRVALMHYRGEAGVTQDYSAAAQLFGKAAEQGDANALFNLGKLYFEGKGVTKDPGKAADYYRVAAKKDHILAINTLGALYRAGAKSDEDRTMAKSYFARSAAFGNAIGLFEAARMTLEEGTDPERLVEAHMYLNLASARSHPNAAEALQELTALMEPEDVEKAQKKALSFVATSPDEAKE